MVTPGAEKRHERDDRSSEDPRAEMVSQATERGRSGCGKGERAELESDDRGEVKEICDSEGERREDKPEGARKTRLGHAGVVTRKAVGEQPAGVVEVDPNVVERKLRARFGRSRKH